MTRCKQQKLAFEPVAGRRVEGRFDGKKLSTDGGLLLVREVASACRFFTRLKSCFIDARNQDAITHSVESLIQQRVYGLLAGYEDLQDHDDFRHDPVAQIIAGRIPGEAPLAGHSTLGRLELCPTGCCESRVSAEGSKSALYRNEPKGTRSKTLRGSLLQTR